jgi:hypothetical protein
MPPPRCLARAKTLIYTFIQLQRTKVKRLARRTASVKNLAADVSVDDEPGTLSELLNLPSVEHLEADSDVLVTSSGLGSSLGSSNTSSWMSQATSQDSGTASDDEGIRMPSLVGIGDDGWDTDDEMDVDADDEGDGGDEWVEDDLEMDEDGCIFTAGSFGMVKKVYRGWDMALVGS